MIRPLDSPTQVAVRDRSRFVLRNYLWVEARNRTTGVVSPVGLWSGEGDVSVAVVDPDTGTTVTRTYLGDGTILRVDPVPLVVGLEVRTVQVELSQIHAACQHLVRGLEPRLARAQLHRGWFSPITMKLVAAPRIRLDGQVDATPIDTPAAGGHGSITLAIVSHTRELTKKNTARRSDESQRLRGGGDRFYQYCDTPRTWPVSWGEIEGGNA